MRKNGIDKEMKQIEGGVCAPKGFSANGIHCGIRKNKKKKDLALIVCGRKEQTIVTALFDNLGKGACGAAIQNMNIMLGLDPYAGLSIAER